MNEIKFYISIIFCQNVIIMICGYYFIIAKPIKFCSLKNNTRVTIPMFVNHNLRIYERFWDV